MHGFLKLLVALMDLWIYQKLTVILPEQSVQLVSSENYTEFHKRKQQKEEKKTKKI